MKKKTKIIVSTVVLTILLALAGGVICLLNFFFGEKEFTYWKSENMGETQAVAIILRQDEEVEGVDFEVYDREVLEVIQKALEPVKMKPSYSFNEPGEEGYFHIELKDANKNYLSLSINKWKHQYSGYVTMNSNGTLDDGIKSWVSQVTISEEDGERLFQLLNEIKEENIRDITVEEVIELAEAKNYDWGYFRQYTYEDVEQAQEKRRDKFISSSAAKLPIEGKEGYLMVWYYHGIIVDKEGTNSYQEIIEALVCNDAGEEKNLYDEDVAVFLEGMK